MVGLVIVSHIQKLAEGVRELALLMAPEATIIAAGGLEDGSNGTSFDKIRDAVKDADSGDGVAVLMDIGSSIMTAEMVREASSRKIALLDCPLAEGATVAALDCADGRSLEEIKKNSEDWTAYKKLTE